MTAELKKMLEGYKTVHRNFPGYVPSTCIRIMDEYLTDFMRQVIVELEGIDKGAVRAFDAIAEEMDTVITRINTLEAPGKTKFEKGVYTSEHKYCKANTAYDAE